ncbi:hypothetical protein VMCG_08036 [Cytospora schulzeri]|uniref:Uncharacterized protein n=1 Tax=Cytospora schulzeri TaxID=448051 RepID=A0A423VRK4_9PEZI|nr:hypothetical protein VMCG_08036 [Valsa malicola]
MLAPATLAVLSPFILGLSRAVVVGPRNSSYDFSANVTSFDWDIFANISSSALIEIMNYPCDKYPDPRPCYKEYYEEKHSCHPFDEECYKDCQNWNDYKRRCEDRGEKCYDKCYYEDRECHREPDRDRQHDRECEPRQDKGCFPGYPEWDDEEEDDDDDYHPHHPKSYITVNYFGPDGTYQEKVWPDGDEHWNDEHFGGFKFDHIKYYAEQEDSEIRCLPMKSWFPWTPLSLEKYVERTEEYGLVVRILKLEKPMPIELIRCDIP